MVMNTQVRRGILNATLAMAIPVIGISATTGALSEQSEIDVFDQALASGSREGAARFFEAFPSSHLGSDLIELLPPDVAAEVCGSLPSGTSSAARHSCGQLSEAVALAPAAGPSEIGEEVVQRPNPQPTEASPTAGVVSVDGDRSQDKTRWLTNGTTEASTDASIDSRRDGLAADDTTADAADDAPEDTDTSTTSDPVDTADTAAETAETAETITGSVKEDSGAVAAGPGGKGSDSGTGGNSAGGGAGGGGSR
jgi:hypothetical protein